MKNSFPKRLVTDRTGEIGVNAVSTVVNDELGWIFRRTHQEHDYGIDGYVDHVLDSGELTGKYIAVQIKCGKSYLNEVRGKFQFRGNEKHLNYLLNQPTPVLLILCDPETRVCYWAELKRDMIQMNQCGWTHAVSPICTFNGISKKSLEVLFGNSTDYVPSFQEDKVLLETLREYSEIHYLVSKEDILAKNLANIKDFVARVSATEQLAKSLQGKISITVSGYEGDSRELFEIPEVRKWAKKARKKLTFWYLCAKEGGDFSTLSWIGLCTCSGRIVRSNKYNKSEGIVEVTYDFAEMMRFIQEVWHGLNMASDRWLWTEDYNRAISGRIVEELTPEGCPNPLLEQVNS